MGQNAYEYDLDILFDMEHLDTICDIYDNIKEYDVDSYSYYFDRIEFKDFYELIKKHINIENSIDFLYRINSNENPYDREDENNASIEDLSRKSLYVKTKKNKLNDEYNKTN